MIRNTVFAGLATPPPSPALSKYDFRPFVPKPDYPRVANLGRDHYEHAERAAANPRVQKLLLEPWQKLYEAPFVGITTDGTPRRGLFSAKPNGAPVDAMAAAAANLLAALSPEQRSALVFKVDAHDWRRWNNTEIYLYQYGLRLEELSETLREGVLAVVRASLSPAGYEKTRDVMRLNLFLGELVGNTKVFGEFSYNFAMFGLPSTSEPWGWQLMGHHLALNCIVIDGQLVLSPTFMGAEPNFADTGPFVHVHLFQDEENRGLALIRALDTAQRERAIVNHSILGKDQPPGRWHPADHLHHGGARRDNSVIPYEGIPAAELSSDQRRRLLDLAAAFIAPMPPGPFTARMEEVERHLDETHFCWIGGTGEHNPFYYRIQSPVVMIEFDHHSGVYLTNEQPEKFHVHTIVRTPNGNDYGADLLRMHYEHAHKPKSI
jgi:hypothetical protein